MNFQQTYLYWLAGAVLLVVAIMSWRDKSNPRGLTTGLFWGLYGLVFLLGDWTSHSSPKGSGLLAGCGNSPAKPCSSVHALQ